MNSSTIFAIFLALVFLSSPFIIRYRIIHRREQKKHWREAHMPQL